MEQFDFSPLGDTELQKVNSLDPILDEIKSLGTNDSSQFIDWFNETYKDYNAYWNSTLYLGQYPDDLPIILPYNEFDIRPINAWTQEVNLERKTRITLLGGAAAFICQKEDNKASAFIGCSHEDQGIVIIKIK